PPSRSSRWPPRWRSAANTRSRPRSWPPPPPRSAPREWKRSPAPASPAPWEAAACGWVARAGSSPARWPRTWRMQHAGATAVLVEDDGVLLGAIAVRDELRPEAGEVVASLHAAGYRVVMLTGDNPATAAALAAQAGIE